MIDKNVMDRLLADTDITDIIDDRIWTTWLPEKTRFPAITCNYESDNPENTFLGEATLTRETITVNLWCDDKETLVTLYEAVKKQMDGWAVRLNKVDLSDEEQRQYRFAVDYSVWG